MRIAVAGGTGLVGRLVVAELTRRGHQPVVLSRVNGVDIVTGTGVAAALDGADTVIDVSNVATTLRRRSIAFFDLGTRNLLAAGNAAGVRHHVALSIVGIDRVDLGYYAGKRRQEELVLAAGNGSVLRATQFHEFAGQLLERGGPVALIPRLRCQPVSAAEVAPALIELALGGPAALVPELAGPEVLELPEMARRLVRATKSRRIVVPVPVPGGKAAATGGLLPTAPGPRGVQTYDEWLAKTAGRLQTQ